MATPSDPQQPRVIQWLVDTRPLWPSAQQTKDLEVVAARALALLTPQERAATLRFYFVRDAKLALASHLLKRLAVHVACGVPWDRCVITRDAAGGKPVYRPDHPNGSSGGSGGSSSSTGPGPGQEPSPSALAFNVTHQAGLAVLAAVAGYAGPGPVDVGVDVVCTSERRDRDREMILSGRGGETVSGRGKKSGGWEEFVDMHADVFAPGEVRYLKEASFLTNIAPQRQDKNSTGSSSNGRLDDDLDEVDVRLRYFYALWCLREAYVKMTGEALLADWLSELEFQAVRPPDATSALDAVPEGAAVVHDQEVVFRHEMVDDVNICLQARGPDYMVSTAVRTPLNKKVGLGLQLEHLQILSMDEIIDLAERSRNI